MKKYHVTMIVYWGMASLLIAFLLDDSFPYFIHSWFTAILFLPAVLLVHVVIDQIKELPKWQKYIRYFLLAVISLDWCYLSLFFSYWYFLELQFESIQPILVNPVFIWMLIGFLVGLERVIFSRVSNTEPQKTITLYSQRKKTILLIANIAYVESRDNFTLVKMTDGSEFENKVTISQWSLQIPTFLRVHRSFLINPRYGRLHGDEITVMSTWTLPVSRTYKKKVVGFFESLQET
jgi:hypothetical protein